VSKKSVNLFGCL